MTKKTKVEDKKLNEEPDHAKNVASVATKPFNRMEMIHQAVNLLGMLPADMAVNGFDAMIAQIGKEAEKVPDGAAGKNANDMKMHPSDASAAMKESVKEAITSIFGDNKDLSEEFKEKCQTLFEAALGARLAVEREEMKALLEKEAEEKVDSALALLVEQLDGYMNYVADEWMKENQVALESSLRTEITEQLLADIKEAFEKNHVKLPDEKIDVLEALGKKVDDLTAKLDAAINEKLETEKKLARFNKQEILDKVSEGLVHTQKEKLATLVEDIDFDNAESYEKKVRVVKDKFILESSEKKTPVNKSDKTGILQEDVTEVNEEKVLPQSMQAYIDALSIYR